MTTMRAWVLAGALAATGVAAVPAALHADWIVTRQGERVEIQGSWQLKGKLVVFTLPNGTLSSMRADLVDFDESKKATAQAKKEAEAPPAKEPAKAKRKAVIVLTDKDFKKTPPAAEAPPADASGAKPIDVKPGKAAGKDNPPAREAPSAVEVVTWDRLPAATSKADGVEIDGTVRNVSQNVLTEVTVMADLFDDNGGLLGRFPAVVANQSLPPAESSKFHLVASGVFAFSSIRWETQGRGLKMAPPTAQPVKPPS